MSQQPKNPVFCAIDTADLDRAETLARAVAPVVGGLKLGKEFFSGHGPAGVARIMAAAPLPLFLDLKFHDIPNTVAGAVRAVCRLAPFMLNVHVAGGPQMLRTAAEATAAAGTGGSAGRPLLIGVTVLTSMDDDDLTAIGMIGPVSDRAVALARLARDCGLDGVVCAAAEIAPVRAACGPAFRLVVPGLRPPGSSTGDQKRVVSPAEALAGGADYLVIGRPITAAADPAAAARAIVAALPGHGDAG